jgi:hypothetical protein
MDSPVSSAAPLNRSYVSTGHLPDPELVQALVNEAYERFRSRSEGHNSEVYPALAKVSPDLFGVCVVDTRGKVYAAGDIDYPFSIMSVSKPFLFALICERLGPEEARDKLGAMQPGSRSTRSPRSNRATRAEPTRWSIRAPSQPPASPPEQRPKTNGSSFTTDCRASQAGHCR